MVRARFATHPDAYLPRSPNRGLRRLLVCAPKDARNAGRSHRRYVRNLNPGSSPAPHGSLIHLEYLSRSYPKCRRPRQIPHSRY